MRPSYLRSAKRGRRERTRQKEQWWWQRTKCRPRLQECRIRARWWRRSMRTRNHRYYCQNFYLAQNGPETTKFGQEMRFCGGGEEASEKRERIIVVLVFVVVVVSACARCRTVVEVLLASYSVVLINAFFFLYVCFLWSTASLPARTETAAESFLATADARDRPSERSKLLRNCLYYLLFLVLYLSRIFS